MNGGLLTDQDAPVVVTVNPSGASPFLLLGDHAGNVVPASLNDLGLSDDERSRHIAWDIGVAGLGEQLAGYLDAVFIRQTYSRLVIDCNRDPARADAIPEVSDGTVIPANQSLSDADRAARVAAVHEPYQAAIAAEIARRDAIGQTTVLVSLHSFTPSMNGQDRIWDAGVLHDGANDAFSDRLFEVMRAEPGLTVGDNEPYRMNEVDHTIPRHAFATMRPYAEIEVRQDHLADEAGQEAWAGRLARWLMEAIGPDAEALQLGQSHVRVLRSQFVGCGVPEAEIEVAYHDDLQDYATTIRSTDLSDAVLAAIVATSRARYRHYVEFNDERLAERYWSIESRIPDLEAEALAEAARIDARKWLDERGLLEGMPEPDLGDPEGYARRLEKHAGPECTGLLMVDEDGLILLNAPPGATYSQVMPLLMMLTAGGGPVALVGKDAGPPA